MRILVTGSRAWDDWLTIGVALTEAAEGALDVSVVHGGARGADVMAGAVATARGWSVEVHRADWTTHGKAAGFIRNQAMVALGADVCLAFIVSDSLGATHCARAAAQAGIPVKRYLA